jgi:predicted GNAT superfamily acetyltransferase
VTGAATPWRPIGPTDRPAVLAWNAAHVELLAPLDADRLDQLIGRAETAAVIEQDGAAAGFVLTFGHGSDYDSVNYRWFAERHTRFTYLDRIVVDASARRTGLGTRVYDALERGAFATGVPVFCLEVNVEPPNEPSLRFHRARGYVEVGRQEAGGHVVALFEKQLT